MPGCASRFHKQTQAIPATCAFVGHVYLAIVMKYRKAHLARCSTNGQNLLCWDLLHEDEKVIASCRIEGLGAVQDNASAQRRVRFRKPEA